MLLYTNFQLLENKRKEVGLKKTSVIDHVIDCSSQTKLLVALLPSESLIQLESDLTRVLYVSKQVHNQGWATGPIVPAHEIFNMFSC